MVTRRALRTIALLAIVVAQAGCPPVRPPNTARDVELLPPELVAQLAAPLASERAHAAWALGQLGVGWDPVPVPVQAAADVRLADRLTRERDPEVRVQLVAALGRVGRSRGRVALLGELETPGAGRARAGWALAHLYRRLRDKDLDPATDVDALAKALVAPEAAVRAAVTDALAETKRPVARPILLRELVDADPLARARAAHGLIGLAVPDDAPALVRALADLDERVAASAALALGELAESGGAPTLVPAMLELALPQLVRPMVVVALAERGFITARLTSAFAEMAQRLRAAGQPRLGCLAALAHDRAAAKLELVPRCDGVDERERARLAARALAEGDPKRVPIEALLALPAGDHQARALVLVAFGRYGDARSAAALVEAAADGDPAIRAAAAEGATLRKLAAAGPKLLPGVRDAAARAASLHPDEIDPLLSIIAALAALRPAGGADALRPLVEGTPAAVALAARDALAAYGERVTAHAAPRHGRFDDAPAVAAGTVVRVETARGPIRIALHPEWAPNAARNFVGLVQAGFYDGLTFHRIVPGFVAQGGDPRGDGSGGAAHLVGCEPNAAAYTEGTVGMALSGPDTGSSQFFIALAPAPHLEGRYTAFAQVLDGMAAARALQPGDRIVSAKLE